MIKYKVYGRGNDSVACEVGPQSGPLNQFHKRTLEDLRDGEMIYKASEVDALLIELCMQLNGVCARTETRRKVMEGEMVSSLHSWVKCRNEHGHVFLPPDTLGVIQDVLRKLYQLEEKV